MVQIYDLDNNISASVVGSPVGALVVTTGSNQTTLTGTITTIPKGLMQGTAASGGFTYFMDALPGTSLAGSTWRISRRGSVSGLNLTQWASGNDNFDKIADTYATYPYT